MRLVKILSPDLMTGNMELEDTKAIKNIYLLISNAATKPANIGIIHLQIIVLSIIMIPRFYQKCSYLPYKLRRVTANHYLCCAACPCTSFASSPSANLKKLTY